MNTILEESIREETVCRTAEQMLIAARTAPKARGIDNLVIAVLDKDGIRELSDKLKEMAGGQDVPSFFLRDANCILLAERVVLIGTRLKSAGLNACDLCGFSSCEEKDKHPDVPCIFNVNDLGIAIGSAVSVAMDNRVDNRVMFTVGRAAKELNLLGDDVKIVFGIPLSVSGKNPFFDRKS